MTQKFQRPVGTYAGQSGLSNRTKYQDDANATPKRPVSSSKVDGDINYLIDAVNVLDDASGTRASIAERLDVSLNADGTLKVSVAGTLNDWVVHTSPGTLARVDNSTFSMNGGDFRALYPTNRRVRVTVSGTNLVGDVASCTFASGATTVSLVDIYDPAGALAVIGLAPTQVAYGPLTPGLSGNVPRRVDSLAVVVGANTISLGNDSGDLAFRRNGTLVARVGAGGISGLATGAVSVATLATDAATALAPTGMLAPFAGSSAPSGWLLCSGQTVSRTTFAALFAVVGTTYGAGDGSTTFAVPDMRGRTVFGLDNMGGTDAGRLSLANTLGLAAGAQTKNATTDAYTLTAADIPAHTHTMARDATGFAGGGGVAPVNGTGTGTAINTGSAGGGGGHSHGISNLDVLPPLMLANWIIKA